MKKLNESKTETLFRELLSNSGITKENGWIVEEQTSDNPSLSFISKTGKNGQGSPDFIIQKKGHTGLVIIVEAKHLITKLEKLDKSGKLSEAQQNINGYASNGAYHYAKCINNSYNVLFIGCAGEAEEFTSDSYYLPKDALEYVKVEKTSLSDINQDLENSIITLNNLCTSQIKEKTNVQVSDDLAKNLAGDIHELLRDHAGVPKNQMATLMSALLLACNYSGFKIHPDSLSCTTLNSKGAQEVTSSKDITASGDLITQGEVIFLAAINEARKTGMEQAKLAKIASSFKFVETNSALNTFKAYPINSTALYKLCRIIKGEDVYKIPKNKAVNLVQQVKLGIVNDILGHFYSEFLSYGGGDGKNLGIILTPPHITELMVNLVGFTRHSIIYDPCIGTGGFLIAAMNKAFKEVMEDTSITDKKGVIDAIRSKAFIGCEVEDQMFTIAITNMILRGDGKSFIFPSSCFDQTQVVKALLPTCAVLNPPYALKDASLSEIKFIEHALTVTIPGSLVVAVVPKSVFLDKNKVERARMLKTHSLVGVITLPSDTFIEVAGTEVAIGIFKSHTPHDSKVKTWLCDFDDGYSIIPKRGRLDVRGFQKLMDELIERFTNKTEVLGYSKLVSLQPEDEALYDCWADTLPANSRNFKEKTKDNIIFSLKIKIEESYND